jgi:KaiC/GvpD/RAD55 family RecA-like ATPase
VKAQGIAPGYVDTGDGFMSEEDWEGKRKADEAVAQRLRTAGIRTAREALESPPPSTPRLLGEGLIVEGGVTSIAGDTGIGKTLLLLHLAWALTEGVPLFGFDVHRSARVLMIQLEISESLLLERIGVMVREIGWSDPALDRFTFRCLKGLVVDQGRGMEWLGELLAAVQPDVAMIDSWTVAVAGDPDRTRDSLAALRVIDRLTEQYGTAWILTQELRKPAQQGPKRRTIHDVKNSNEAIYHADCAMLMEALDDRRVRSRLTVAKMRHAEMPAPLELFRRGLIFEVVTQRNGDRLLDEQVERVMEFVIQVGAATRREIRGGVMGGSDKTDAAIRVLIERGALIEATDQRMNARGQLRETAVLRLVQQPLKGVEA